MSFSATWHNLLENVEEVSADATLVTPLSRKRFRVVETQEHRVVVEYREDGDRVPLERDQFETLVGRVRDAPEGFDLDRLPPDAEPYATVLSLHPRFEIDDREGVLAESETPTGSPLVDADLPEGEAADREEPDVSVYADALLLVDALERHDPTDIEGMGTPALVNLYTLLSDVQRSADDLRTEVSEVLLDRLHHDQPVSGQFGSVQRTSRRRRSLKDETEVLATLEAAGIDRERVTAPDPEKVEEALAVTELATTDVFEVEQREYVRKASVDEAEKETRLQGLKDRLAAAREDAGDLQAEIEDLEARIEDLTSFDSGRAFHTRTGGET
jgi:hypothetical protein